jgi:hypothetical protein
MAGVSQDAVTTRAQASAKRGAGAPSGNGVPERAWLVLVYRVPSEPTRLRAAVWRRLKTLGAIYLQGSVVAIPATVSTDRAFRALRNEIVQDMGGTAVLLRSHALVGGPEIVESFNAARDDEYREIIDRCEAFLVDIEEQTSASHFTFAGLEERDDGLTKLRRSLDKVQGRDLLDASTAATAHERLARCTAALNSFADRVYQVDSGSADPADGAEGPED